MPAPIQLFTASQLSPLLAHLADDMQRAPLSPLESETIVVQSQGMRRWLTLELADTLGCAASLTLPFPAAFMHDLARRQELGRAARDAGDGFSREALVWRVESLLRALPHDDVYAPLQRYLHDNDDRARFGLAERIADRFDDYQLYRSDVLASWEAGDDVPGTPHARWQAAIWRTLCRDGLDATPHAGARLRQLIAVLRGVAPRGLPARVTVFGVSTLPPLFMEVLAAMSTHIPVAVYSSALTPSPAHPLAQALGEQSREFIDVLRTLGAQHTVLDAVSRRNSSLLHRLQGELTVGTSGTAPIPLDGADASLRVHSAHGGMRQLEIVRDQLLDALRADPELRPHDLLLLVPDAGTWAPLVDAVFGVNEPDTPRIPYRIADRAVRREDLAAAALSQLLAMQGGRLTHSDVFELLANPLVHEAAELSEAQVDALASLTHAANTRWGYDAASRASIGLPAYEAASWRASLDRLLIGIATGRHDDLVLDVLPHVGDTAGDAAGIARLAEWVDALAALLEGWDAPRSLTSWIASIEAATDMLFGVAEQRDAGAVATVVGVLDTLRTLALEAASDGVLPFGVVRDWIDGQLDGDGDGFGSGFLAGGLTVAALKPMRSLPFRIIAVVGLDEGVFPRRDRRSAFDLLEHERRSGDRDLRSDDRQLFLDLLLAAGDRLILTYSGRAVSDNSPCAASVVIDELLDHLDRRSDGAARRTVLVEHPLQPFSRQYFAAGRDPRLFTFSTAHARAAQASLQERATDVPFVTAPIVHTERAAAPTFELTIAELADCWCNPSKYFCRQALGFTVGDGDDAADDEELLVPDAKAQGSVKARLLAAALDGDSDTARAVRRLQGEGALPPGTLGAAHASTLGQTVADVLALVPMELDARIVPVSVSAADWRVSGTLGGVRGTTRYVVRAGGVRALHEVRAWIEHLVMCAAHATADDPATVAATPVTTVLIGVDAKKAKVVDTLQAPHDAMAVLAELVAAARAGRESPLAFFPSAAMAWLKAYRGNQQLRKNASPKDPREEARRAFDDEGTWGGVAGDHADAHVALCFRGIDPLVERWDEFEQLARLIFNPRLPATGGV